MSETAARTVAQGPATATLGVEAPGLRRPRLRATLNGTNLDDVLLDAKVETNRYGSADTFSMTLRMAEEAGASVTPSALADMDAMEVTILAGDPEPTVTLFDGRADDVEMEYARRTIRLSGRDRTADLIEAKTTEKWPNRTSSEIAEDIARRRGLTPVVTRTTTRSGTYYQAEHARLTNEVSEWTLLTYLAEQEGFDVFVRGRELHFRPPLNEATAPRWGLDYVAATTTRPIPEAPVGRMTLRRNLTVARGIKVIVISWNAGQARPIRAEARADRGARAGRRASQVEPQTYVIREPGLTQEQATQLAQRKRDEFSRHERTVDADGIPADVRLTPEHLMVLTGTGGSFDQSYRLDAIGWSYGQTEGFTMRLRARNLTPSSTATL